MAPTRIYYAAKAIGDFGNDWLVTGGGTKVQAVNSPTGGILHTPTPETNFEIAITWRDDFGQVFDPVHFQLDPDEDTGEFFEQLWNKDSNDEDWDLTKLNQGQLICQDYNYATEQSFKFFPQPEPMQTWNIVRAGFALEAKVSPDPEGRKIMVFHLRKMMEYVVV